MWCWISGARSATNPDAAAAAEGGLAGGLAVMAAGALTGLPPQRYIQQSRTQFAQACFRLNAVPWLISGAEGWADEEERGKSWLQMHGASVESAERICRNFRDSGSTPETWVGLLEGMERTTVMLMIDEVRYQPIGCRQLTALSGRTT